MIIDSQARFEWTTPITTTRVSTNAYDLTSALRDIGQSDCGQFLVGSVTTAFTAAGSATLQCDLIQSANADLSSADTLATIMAATGKATLVAGYTMFRYRIPIGIVTKRYVGLNWTVATGPMTAGAVSAFITPNVDAQTYLPKGYVNF